MTTPQSAKPTAPLTRGAKGKFARRLVIYCICILSAAGVWAAVVKTMDPAADLSDVLTFLGAAFGGELLLLLVKRVCAKNENADDLQ